MKLDQFTNIQRDVPLKGYSTFGVGGSADYFYTLKDLKQFPSLIETAKDDNIPVFILGGGSNVLFLDGGFRGLVMKMEASDVRVEGNLMVADAGIKWPAILNAAKEAELTGLEPMAGLPGTIGGAVVGNAGCFGLETADVLESAQIYDCENGEIHTVGPDYFQFNYRWSRIKETHDVILQVTLRLDGVQGGPEEKTVKGASDVRQKRFEKQPPGKTSGSFFKNPSPEQPAGWLIDQCGLKGLQIGGAQISPKHANFFMNIEAATASDILALRDRAKEAVLDQFGIELHEEIRIIGE